MAIKLICGTFLVVVLLGYLADAKSIVPDPQMPKQRPFYQSNPGQTSFNPQVGQNPTSHDQEYHSCDVAESDRVACGVEGISQTECERINCCYSSRGCYFGMGATLHCTTDGNIILAVARESTVPSIDLTTVALLGNDGPQCRPIVAPAFIIYQFNPNQCGTELNEDEEGVVAYHNKLSTTFAVQSSSTGDITRDTVFEVDFQCRYSGKAIHAFIYKPLTLPDPLPFATYGNWRVGLRLGNGKCTAKGCVEEDVAFTSYYSASDYPVSKVLQEYVYVEVGLIEQSDPDLHLQLRNCWVTTNENPYSHYRWDLLRNGCPNTDDLDPTKLIDVDPITAEFPTHYKRFAFKMFTFVNRALPADPGKKTQQFDAEVVEPLRDHLYIHCDCAVCKPSAMNSCQTTCFSRKKRDIASAKMTYRAESSATQLATGASVVTPGGV